MTDDDRHQSVPDGMFSPDGWGIYHEWEEPVDDVRGYIHGPFPTYEIAEHLMKASPCQCATSLVPLMFPSGISMRMAMDVEDLLGKLREVRAALDKASPPKSGNPVVPDRVH
jgi:hypothetical protein